ncbi:hypothetical protein KEM55_002941 [Ascosphaera atra]|nr:hypothetical protein KEM55_002941 [Ascosphaera atra]
MANTSQSRSRSRTPASPTKGAEKQMKRLRKQAAALFSSRQWPQALETINTLVLPPSLQPQASAQTSTALIKDASRGEQVPPEAAPVTYASRPLRVKIWCFYITLLNVILTDEGREAFEEEKWRAILSSIRNGKLWEYVVQTGYGGREGAVDGEVVHNLAILVYHHSPSQTLNQQRLETYLATAGSPDPFRRDTPDAPSELDVRVQILELFTLSVLPRNEEWDYAREFIKLSDILDDEKKEAFLAALDSMKEARDLKVLKSTGLQEQRDQEYEEQKRREQEVADKASADLGRNSSSSKSASASTSTSTQVGRDESSGETYGIKDGPLENRSPRPINSPAPAPKKSAIKPSSRPPIDFSASASPSSGPISSTPNKQKPQKKGALRVIGNILKALMRKFSSQVSTNPMGFLKFVLFVTGIVMALRRADVRDRVRRVAGSGWKKVSGTVGMGTKVSYM